MHVAVIPSMVGMPRVPSAVRFVLAAMAWCALTRQAFAQAPCDEDVSPAPGPCVISANVPNVPTGAEWDVGTRSLVIASGKTVTVTGIGNFHIHAANVTLEANAKIIAFGTDGFGGSVAIDSDGSIELKTGSRIDVSAADFAGIIDLNADTGALTMQGQLKAKGTGGEPSGGFVSGFGLTGATIGGTGVDASAGGLGEGGFIDFSTDGDLVVAGTLDASGGDSDAGEIDLGGGTGVTTLVGSLLDVHARSGAGFGGSLSIGADGPVTLNGSILGTASSSADGDGGGAEVDVTTETGDVNFNGPFDVRGAGSDGDGGLLSVSAGGSINVTQPITAFSKATGFGFGGNFELHAGGAVTVASAIDLRGGISGGAFSVVAATSATITGSVLVSGTTIAAPQTAARGGAVLITACTVNGPQGGSIVNLGSAEPERGVTELQASSGMTIGGTLTAGTANIFEWRDVPPTFLPTQNITPPPQQPQNPNLKCCSGNCSSTTTTVPSTTTTTTTVPDSTTTTSIPGTTTTTTTIEGSTTTTTTVESSTTTTTVDGSTTSTTAETSTTTTTQPPTTSTTTTTIPVACVDQPLVGYDAIGCRLDTLGEALAGETPDTLGGKTLAKRMTLSLSRAKTAVTAAREGRKVKPNLRKANRQLHVFQKSVTVAQRKGMTAELGASLSTLAAGATNEVGVLRAAQQ
jgi:hypothetical protein